MKVALINSPWTVNEQPERWGVRAGSRWPHFQFRDAGSRLPRYIPFPFFLAISASVLQRAGHEVLLIDGVAEGLSIGELHCRLAAFGPELIFAESSTPSLRHDLDVFRELRRAHAGAMLVGGGTHAPALAHDMLKREGVPDYWIAGEYDLALASLVASLEGRGRLSDVPGLVTPEAPCRDLARVPHVDELPRPAFDQLPMASYSDPVCGLPAPGAQSWLSRGCPFRCTFCVWPQLLYGNHKYRARAIGIALDEVEHLIHRHGCESFYFDDDTANLGEGRMEELAHEIVRRGLSEYPWAMMARADCMTPAMMGKLARAGLYSIKYGVESSDPELCDACGKGTDWGKLRQALQ